MTCVYCVSESSPENKGFSLSTTDDRIVFRFEGKILMTSYKKNRIISIWRVCGSNYSVVFWLVSHVQLYCKKADIWKRTSDGKVTQVRF